ncbi:FMN reductase [Nocardioides psychrotolerans]|uniref:FMN reductase n=1 Tax=Nocardioides psychrotolerans TaxID=1005945 RepID=A0A1I3H7A9_9ACTN|nr:NAD(P)H-dependent oxidoreductase [Nocardioides psychrotolerans]GEP37723.1 FMN reductase [Nocardioides psychrotolerans]SFI31460.1 FMN reductase [Nocardioides psychrotolerans]
MTGASRVAVVVGNPQPASRTLKAAAYVATELSGHEPDLVVDLATTGPGLLDWADPDVDDLVSQVAAADLVVVATPTYKATYSGLLKLFLARFAPQHGTVLSEIGATVPVRGLYVLDSAHADPTAYDAWLATARPVVSALLTARLTTGVHA